MKKLLVCNQKMFLTYDEAENFRKKMDEIDFSNVDLIVCPSYLNFNAFRGYMLGAQNCFYEKKGAYTGEVSAYCLMLEKIKYCIIGHSERRSYDTDSIINLKVKELINNMMIPIICIGESKMDKDLRRESEVLKKQLYGAINGILPNDEIIVAYEPVWAIGSGDNLTKDEIEDTIKYIRKLLNQKGIINYKLLYGGSVSASNIKDILTDEIDGYLIGNASVNIEELNYIVKCIK